MTEPTDGTAPTPSGDTTPATTSDKSASIRLLETEIADLAQRATLAHRATAQHFGTEFGGLTKDLDGDKRRLAGLEGEANVAESQAKAAKAEVDGGTDTIADLENAASSLEAAGDRSGAAEVREDIAILKAVLRTETERFETVSAEATRLRSAVTEVEAEVKAGAAAITTLQNQSRAAENAADSLDAKGALLQESLTHALELERLTDEAHRLDDEGKTVEAQAARDQADEEATIAVAKMNEAYAVTVDDDALAAIPGAVRGGAPLDLGPGPDSGPQPTVQPTTPGGPTTIQPPGVPATPGSTDPEPPAATEPPPADHPAPAPTDPTTVVDPAPADPAFPPGPTAPATVTPEPVTPAPPSGGTDPATPTVTGPAVPATPTATDPAAPATPPTAPPAAGPPAAAAGPLPIDQIGDPLELRSRAASLRHEVLERYERDATQVGIERDDAARRATSAVQEAKAADMQIAREQKVVAETRVAIVAEDAKIAQLDKTYKFGAATEATEHRAELQQRLETATARVDRATEAATDLRQEAAVNAARVTELEAHQLAQVEQVNRANRALDAMELKADHITIFESLSSEGDRAHARAVELRAAGRAAEADASEDEAQALHREAIARFDQIDTVVIDEKLLVPVVAPPRPMAPTPAEKADGPAPTVPAPAAPVAAPPTSSDPAVALTQRAAAARAALAEHTGDEKIRIDVARDEAARKAWALEQEAKTADEQAGHEDAAIGAARADISKAYIDIAKADAIGNQQEVDRLTERMDARQSQLEVHLARHEDVRADASRLRVETATQKAEVTRLEAESTATTERATAAEKAVDAMEDKAALLRVAENLELEASREEPEGRRLIAEGKVTEGEVHLTNADKMREDAKVRFDKAAEIVVNDRAIDAALPAATRATLPGLPDSTVPVAPTPIPIPSPSPAPAAPAPVSAATTPVDPVVAAGAAATVFADDPLDPAAIATSFAPDPLGDPVTPPATPGSGSSGPTTTDPTFGMDPLDPGTTAASSVDVTTPAPERDGTPDAVDPTFAEDPLGDIGSAPATADAPAAAGSAEGSDSVADPLDSPSSAMDLAFPESDVDSVTTGFDVGAEPGTSFADVDGPPSGERSPFVPAEPEPATFEADEPLP